MRLLLLISTTTYRADDFVHAAEQLGLELVKGIDTGPAPAVRAMTPLGLDFRNPDAAVRAILRYAASQSFRAIVPVDDRGTLIAARASEALGLPHNPPEAVFAARDKHRMRQLLASAGVPSPEFQLHTTDADPGQIAAIVEYPCVLKPTSLSGSRGVIRADDPAGFLAAWHRLRAILRDAARDAGVTDTRHILVERFLPGREFALEGLLTGGRLQVLALFDKPDPLDGPFFEETIYVTPSRLPASDQAAIADCAACAAAALGLREGPVHAELRLNDDGPWVVEVAARSIGGLCGRILRFGTGMSLEELILRHAVGREIPTTSREDAAAGVMMLPIPEGGILTEIAGVPDAEQVPGIEAVEIMPRPGHVVTPLPEGSSYLGFLFARGATPDAVETALREAHARLRFHISPPLTVE